MRKDGAILIFGPTASGKSGLAARLAEHVGGLVINADSMQVYRELRILTARPSAEEEARIPHALYGFVPATEPYSAGRYAADAARALNEARARGLRPIIVGGTGLYFMALTDGLSPIPPIDEAVRKRWRERAMSAAPGELHAALAERDPDMAARLAPGDTQRIARALEVREATGKSLRHWQVMPREPVLDPETTRIVVAPERDELHRRIAARFSNMMDSGALDEVARFGQLKLDEALPLMGALGVKPLLRHVRGEVARREAMEEAQIASISATVCRPMPWPHRLRLNCRRAMSTTRGRIGAGAGAKNWRGPLSKFASIIQRACTPAQ
jgi:tRNA dimethylallyltransferase